MHKVKIAVLTVALFILGGCALSPTVEYKKSSDPVTVSTSDEGLSSWTEIPAEEIRLENSNVFVGGAPFNFAMMGGVVVADKGAGNARLAKLIPPGFGLEQASIVAESLQAAVKASRSSQALVLSRKHLESTDIHITPMVRLIHVGDAIFKITPQLKSSFLDSSGKRQVRTYVYDSQLKLPMTGASATWASNDLRLYKRYLSSAYETLTQVILMDQQGRFLKSFNAEPPNVIREEKIGMITAKIVLLEDLADFRITHEMVGSTRGTQHITIEDKRPPDALLSL